MNRNPRCSQPQTHPRARVAQLQLAAVLLCCLAWLGQANAVQGQDQVPPPTKSQSSSTLESQSAGGAVRVMTFNIRYNNSGDGENAWPNRKDMVAGIIRDYKADIVGLQEALPAQLSDLESRLEEFKWYGVGRNDGKAEGSRSSGEFSAILYRKDRFELQDSGTFWLSETRDKPGSKSWDAALPRICSWVKLKDNQSDETLFAFNTHFDHVGETARQESARILLQELPKIAGDAPFVLTGDFNAAPDSQPYAILTGKANDENKSEDDGAPSSLRDSMSITEAKPVGPDSTWNGFRAITPGRRIDYIFLHPSLGTVRTIEVIDKQVDGRFPSDHLPVVAEIVFAK